MLSLRTPTLPYESDGAPSRPKGLLAGCTILAALSAIEILAFTVGGLFASGAAYLWFALGAFSFVFLCWKYLAATFSDLRRGALWGLVPLVAGIPVCFFGIDSFAYLNTESLSELHDTYQQLQKPDRAYTSVFWFSYPSRSLTLNLLPTALFGVNPLAYRVGFSYPVFFGALFLFAGIRRYHARHIGGTAIAGLAAGGIFAYPMFCQITRTFEMAISSASFGMWAIGALLLFAAEPTVLTAVVAAWTIGLLSASFTSGLALVALLWCLLALWATRAFIRKDRAIGTLVSSVLLYCVVVGTALYLIRPRTLRAKQIPFSEMLNSFAEAISYTASFSHSVFTPTALVIPTIIALLFAISLRGGVLSLLLAGWCFPVIWSAANLQGKIGPQLPFALYRSLIIVPVILYVMGRCVLWILGHFEKKRWLAKILVYALAIGLYFPLASVAKYQAGIQPPRPPEGREVLAKELVTFAKTVGFSPYTHAWIANRTDTKIVDNFLPCLQYFFLGWTRIDLQQPLPTNDTTPKTPGIIVTMQGDPLTTQTFPGYKAQTTDVPLTFHRGSQAALSFIVLQPE